MKTKYFIWGEEDKWHKIQIPNKHMIDMTT